MDRPKHLNTGNCEKCIELFDKYPGFHPGLRGWFTGLQLCFPDAHISCAGRGKYLQELYFKQGSTRAHWMESAHNYNLAIDIFRLTPTGAEWGPTWFRNVVGAAVKAHNEPDTANKISAILMKVGLDFKIKWYGDPDSRFFELPHCEVDGWKSRPDLTLVEGDNASKKTTPPDSNPR